MNTYLVVYEVEVDKGEYAVGNLLIDRDDGFTETILNAVRDEIRREHTNAKTVLILNVIRLDGEQGNG